MVPQSAVFASCDLALAIMEPGRASVRVCRREPVGVKVAVGFEVSMLSADVPLRAEAEWWLSLCFLFWRSRVSMVVRTYLNTLTLSFDIVNGRGFHAEIANVRVQFQFS